MMFLYFLLCIQLRYLSVMNLNIFLAIQGSSAGRSGIRRKFASRKPPSERQTTLDSSDEEPGVGILELSPEGATTGSLDEDGIPRRSSRSSLGSFAG